MGAGIHGFAKLPVRSSHELLAMQLINSRDRRPYPCAQAGGGGEQRRGAIWLCLGTCHARQTFQPRSNLQLIQQLVRNSQALAMTLAGAHKVALR